MGDILGSQPRIEDTHSELRLPVLGCEMELERSPFNLKSTIGT